MNTKLSLAKAKNLLEEFEHKHLISKWSEARSIVSAAPLNQSSKEPVFKIQIPFASYSLIKALKHWLTEQQLDAIFRVETKIQPLTCAHAKPIKGVKNMIAITSAKGGVGKSTTAINLALSLHRAGAKVGILDADIYGPSIPIMLGTQHEKPQVYQQKWMRPILSQGIFSQSIGYLMQEQNAAIWRGPMAAKAFTQLLEETLWPDIDYLIVDMPPGTGDLQLTLAQKMPVTSAVIVTTPQDLALADAIRGVNMFKQVNVPVAGIIENMSYHICESCGHQSHIFGRNGAIEIAKNHDLPILGQIPLDISIRQAIDLGLPTMSKLNIQSKQHDDVTMSQVEIYQDVADQIAAQLFWQGEIRDEPIFVTQINS